MTQKQNAQSGLGEQRDQSDNRFVEFLMALSAERDQWIKIAGNDAFSAQRASKELKLIGAALTRMRNGTYGVCETCDEVIAIERLRKIPATRFCIECQAQQEDSQVRR